MLSSLVDGDVLAENQDKFKKKKKSVSEIAETNQEPQPSDSTTSIV